MHAHNRKTRTNSGVPLIIVLYLCIYEKTRFRYYVPVNIVGQQALAATLTGLTVFMKDRIARSTKVRVAQSCSFLSL
jgi:hypothetical protein